MATLFERVMAKFDIAVHVTFQMMYDFSASGTGAMGKGLAYQAGYHWGGLGKRFAIVRTDGSIPAMGNSWWVEHEYDEDGKLVSRKRMVNTRRTAGDRVVYGDEAVSEVYSKRPGADRPMCGICS
mgnify:CR=1 FL=1